MVKTAEKNQQMHPTAERKVNLLDGVMFVRFLLRARIFVLCSEGISDA
jgi:hypothetical protein